MSGTFRNLVKLLVFEAIAIWITHQVVLQLFDIDLFDFSSTEGQIAGASLSLITLYYVVTSIGTDEVARLGAMAAYDPNTKNRAFVEYYDVNNLTKVSAAQSMLVTP